jgi:TRAP-type mannitol/chloroaromatic compound transport system permease large subunit
MCCFSLFLLRVLADFLMGNNSFIGRMPWVAIPVLYLLKRLVWAPTAYVVYY